LGLGRGDIYVHAIVHKTFVWLLVQPTKWACFPVLSSVELVLFYIFVSLKQLFVPSCCCFFVGLLSHCCCVSFEFWLLVAIQLAFASLGFCNIATVIIARHALLSALYFSYFCCNYCSFLISTKRE